MNYRKLRKLLSSPREFFIDALNNKIHNDNKLINKQFNYLEPQNKYFKINQKTDTTIMTFGSCFARRIAEQYVRVFGGKVISSVYHNRSDYFCQQFIDGVGVNHELDTLIKSIKKPENFMVENPDRDPFILLKNQHIDHIGLHSLKNGNNFLNALETKKIDIIIIDNFMDILARLYQQDTKKLFFLPQPRIDELNATSYINKDWVLGELLDPQEGAEHLSRIVNHIHMKRPEANIFYANFPSTAYEQHLEKKNRFEQYRKSFKNIHCHSIAPIQILRSCKTEDKQHFSPTLYAAYAGIINALLCSK